MKKTKSFEELIVWQKAHRLTLDVCKMTQRFPKEEIYGITSQIRRASVSIAANIAEGYRRRKRKGKARFFSISEGSLDEVKYYLILAKYLSFIKENTAFLAMADVVSKLLYSYKTAILKTDSYLLNSSK